MPYNGKKTVPAALRKDLWSPLATISFPPGSQSIGLSTFQKLREYKRLHELQWDDSLMKDEEGKFIPKSKRGRQINDQKANVVADMATVLGKIGTPEGEAIGLKGNLVPETPVEVKWTNVLDAEFAETWSSNVVHDTLIWDKNHRDLSGAKLTQEEKGERNRAYWAELERKRVEYHASKGEEAPPEKSYNIKIEASLEREQKNREKLERKAAQVQAKKKGIQTELERKRSEEAARLKRERQEKKRQTEEKQKLYWEEMEKKRVAWYVSQGKVPPPAPAKVSEDPTS